LLAGDWLSPALKNLTGAGQIYNAVATHVPQPLGEVAPHGPIGLRGIVMKAVSPNPADRYANAAELAAALGGRARVSRVWTRDTPCAGHTTCFTGSKPGASTFKVCAVPTGNRGRHIIESWRVPARTRVNPWPEVTRGQLMPKLGARLRELS
jgi:hypothetical protein